MTAAPVNQSESSPREAAMATAQTSSSRTRSGLYLACCPHAESDEQHIDPQDACEDEYEDIEHEVPKADEPPPPWRGGPDESPFG